jgi:integrator complex subunit 11
MASQAKIEAIPLGGGQEIGRSCVLVKLGGYRVLLDCGIHTAFVDERCFPRFDLLLDGHATGGAGGAGGGGGREGDGSLPHCGASGQGLGSEPAGAAGAGAPPAVPPASPYAHCVDAVFITHYHLDHVGALPHLVGVLGYRGPVFMTSATRAIAQVSHKHS